MLSPLLLIIRIQAVDNITKQANQNEDHIEELVAAYGLRADIRRSG